jgi:ribosomal protein S18 acetylase RimI-like enzyme
MPIRIATSADTAALVDLMAQFYRESFYSLQRDAAGSAFQQLMADSALGRVWICEQKSQAAGYIVLTFGFSMEYGGRDGFVDDLFVRPEFRGRVLDKQLLDTLIRECVRLQVRALHLEVGRANHRAKALYQSRGFRYNDRQLLTIKLARATHEPKRRAETDASNASQVDEPGTGERPRGKTE